MTKLETRPILLQSVEEMFYLDIQANPESQVMQSAPKELSRDHALNESAWLLSQRKRRAGEPA